jgi:cell division protein FtsA
MYATAVGLVMNSLQSKERSIQLKGTGAEVVENASEQTAAGEMEEQEMPSENDTPKERKRFFDKWAEKFKEFLDNAE